MTITAKCDLFVDLKSSATPKMSTIPEVWNLIGTFNILREYQGFCSKSYSSSHSKFCNWLVKDNKDSFSLKNVLDKNSHDIEIILNTILILEKKAIVCRGVRYLLSVIIHGIFMNGLIKNENIEQVDAVEELYKTKSEFFSSIYLENQEKFQNIGQLIKTQINNGSNENGNSENLESDRVNEIGKELSEAQISVLEKIKLIFQVIQKFSDDFEYFRSVNLIYDTIITMKTDTESYSNFLLVIFKIIKDTYKVECFPDSSITVFVKKSIIKNLREKNCTIPVLIKEIEQNFINAKQDFRLINIKFSPIFYDSTSILNEHMSIKFFQLFNKHYDTVWKLIGDELMVNEADSSETVSLNNIIIKKENEVKTIAKKIDLLLENTIKCRCLLYLNLMIKLYYYTINVLLVNERQIREITLNRREENIVEIFLKTTNQRMDTSNDAFTILHEKMKQYEITENTFTDSKSILLAIDELNQNKINENKMFKNVSFVCLKYVQEFIFTMIDGVADYREEDEQLVADLSAMLNDMEKPVMLRLERQTIETQKKWYEWGKRMYEDECFYGDYNNPKLLFTFDEIMAQLIVKQANISKKINDTKITLQWIINALDTLRENFQVDLEKVYG